MTTPTQDRDITATLSAPREEPTAEALEAAAARLLREALFRGSTYSAGYGATYWCIATTGPIIGSTWSWAHGGTESRRFATPGIAAVDLLRHHPELWPAEPDKTVEWEHVPEGDWYRSQHGRPPACERVDVRTSGGRIFRNVCTVNHAWNWKAVQWRTATTRDGARDETAPDHWATIRAALAPGATDDARAAALVAVDAMSQKEDR